MRPRHSLLACLIALAVLALCRAEPSGKDQPGPEAKRIQELILQLGSDEFTTREKAAQELEKIGVPALEALQRATRSDDLETRRAAEELVAKVQASSLAATMLAPRKVSLNLKDVSLAEAVAQLSRQSGYAVQLAGNQPIPADQKITLQVKDVSFWDALTQLCEKAGLTEQRANPVTGKGEIFLLTRGKGPQLSAGSFGAVRLGVLPPAQAQIKVPAGKANEAFLVLEATAEPRLKGFGMVGVVRVQKAVDDQGQTLQVASETTPPPADPDIDDGRIRRGRRGGVIIIRGNVIVGGAAQGQASEGQGQVALRIQRGQKPARVLKELTGVVTAQAYRDLQEDLLVVDNILKATGVHKGKKGEEIEITSVTQEQSGSVQIEALLRNLAGQAGQAGRINIRRGNVVIRGNGGMADVDPAQLPRLLDTQGKAYQLAQTINQGIQIGPAGIAQQVTLVYRPGAGQKEPARLVLRGQQMVIFEVPFTLKNVPLP